MKRFKESPRILVRSLARPDDMYEYVFATRSAHDTISTLEELKISGDWSASLGLFWNGTAIGSGELCKLSWRKKHLHTDDVRLMRKYRNKGHGIALYMALILCAKNLGAKRIYSSRSLNIFSSRMWKEKLGKVGYKVKKVGRECSHPCSHCDHHPQYFIEL